jgi:tetratricopeptide (TPR) repeat protein
LTAAAARAASFPQIRDRVALLNRILIIDPNQTDALTVLTRNLYAVVLNDAKPRHNLIVKDPALSLVVNEHYWNVYAQATRVDLSLGMEIGGFDKPTTADYLYRLLSALKTLAEVRPEQLDNRFRWGAALRWNNDQEQAIEVHEKLVKDVPAEKRAGKAEALLQLAWSRINKVAWNRNFDDPDVAAAYRDADEALTYAEIPLDKFLAEYTKAYSLLFAPKRDNQAIFQHLTEAKRWFDETPAHQPEIWKFFVEAEQLKMVMDADPIFEPLLPIVATPTQG